MNHKAKGFFAGLLFFAIYSSGCGPGFQAGTDVTRGRQSLIMGDYQTALTYFERAAQTDPNYIYGTELREGVFSFLGRTQYLIGDLAHARPTLERSLSLHKSDNLARLYLGLTLARQNDRTRGLQRIQSGLNGINNFINYITTAFASEFGQFWDPGQDIRKAVTSNLQTIARGNFDWSALISNSEDVAMKFEREPDFAQQQEEQNMEMNFQR